MSSTERRPHLLHADQASQGKIVRARGDLYLFKALAAQTEGHYSLFEARSLTGGGVPLHRHHHDEEASLSWTVATASSSATSTSSSARAISCTYRDPRRTPSRRSNRAACW
jgi:hypothetical protein